MTSPETKALLTNRIGAVIDQFILPIFKEGAKITVLVRHPGFDDADVVVTSDDDAGVHAIIGRQFPASPSGAGLGGAVASSEAVDALRAFVAVTPLPFGSVGTRDVDIASWHAAHKAASTVLASQPGCAVEGEAVRSAETWKVTTPDGSHSWFTEDAEEVAHFSLPGQGHKIEHYAAQ